MQFAHTNDPVNALVLLAPLVEEEDEDELAMPPVVLMAALWRAS